MPLKFVDWGEIEYTEALARQEALVEQVIENPAAETVVFCSHPAIVTLGRQTKPQDLYGWRGATSEIKRGGRATYHGPGQLVIYPILSLERRKRDLHKLLRNLELALTETLTDFYGLTKVTGKWEGETGVWVDGLKVASIGVAVRRWVCYHGAAINLTPESLKFSGINPCGLPLKIFTCLEELLEKQRASASTASQKKLDPTTFKSQVQEKLSKYFSLQVDDCPPLTPHL